MVNEKASLSSRTNICLRTCARPNAKDHKRMEWRTWSCGTACRWCTQMWDRPNQMIQGVSKKTSFCQNWPWQILLMIMRNPLSFFMTNALSALAFMSIIALLTIAGSICATSLGILQQNLPGAQAESSWYPSSYGTPFQERIAEADRIAALEASLFWKNTTPSLKKKNNLGQIHHMYSHINLLSEKGLVFYLYLQKFHMDFSLSTVIFAMANFDKRKFFF